jgi:two-component system CheB/CheR fusion protein
MNEPAPINTSTHVPIVGVAASAGDIEAIIELLRHIPEGAGLAFVLIQHLDPTHPSYFSEALGKSTSLPVHEIEDGMHLEPDHVYVVPANGDVRILKGTLALLPRAERKPHLPIDFFFKGLAADLGNQALGVVLSGTGYDGAEGLRAIKAEDGVTFAEDPRSAKFSDMPEAAVRMGAVDFCLPIPELAMALVRIGKRPFLRAREAESEYKLASVNEELQSLNEELQTTKEELQSTNEELSTLNEELRTRNAELDLANSDLANVLRSVEIPIVIVDRRRHIRRFTPKARPILNLLPTHVGRPIDDIEPNLALDGLDQKIAEVIDSVAPYEEEVQSRDGRWYRLQIRPYVTVDKKIDGAVLSVIDIDVLNRALGAGEWTRDYAKAMVEAVHVPLVVINEEFEIVSANAAFEAHYVVPNEAIEGRSIQDFMDGALDIPEIRAALERVRERNESFQRLEVECELPGLGTCSLSLSGRAMPQPDTGRLILLAVEDITERQRGEASRANLLRESEIAKASAEEANRTKDLFLATLSHELRTPLSSLLLCAQLLRSETMDEAKIRKTSETIERATKAQAKLIEDLLDISRIVTGKLKMELQEVSLASVVQAAVDTLGPTAEKKQLEIELHLDESLPPVLGDPVRLQQIVSNLLSNAIKFTPERGRVTITVDSADGRGRISVTDTGVGIDPDFLPIIFNRFSQEERVQSRTYGGLGLGLAIVRYLVEAHEGSVEAESAGRSKGATFTISLPVTKQSELPPPSDGLPGSIEGVRVLVVEDDPGMREALAEMLSLSGAEVRAAESAAMAMALFEEFRPELLVCDIAMPDEDGYSLLRKIRAMAPERGGNVPALALTALASEEDRRRAFEAGLQGHMSKPVDIDRLLMALTGLLKPRAASADAEERTPGP